MFKLFISLILSSAVMSCATFLVENSEAKSDQSSDSKPLKAQTVRPKASSQQLISKSTNSPEPSEPQSIKGAVNSNTSPSAAEIPRESKEPVKALLKKYKSKGPVKIKLRKKLKSPYKIKEVVSEGVLQLKGGRLRLELSKPDKSLMVVDGKFLWLENSIQGFDGKIRTQVTKVPLTGQRKSSALLALLFNETNELKEFRFTKYQADDAKEVFTFVPKNNDSEYTRLEIAIRKNEDMIMSLSYEDELENQVTYDFGTTTFRADLSDKEFKYEPPKGASVSEL